MISCRTRTRSRFCRGRNTARNSSSRSGLRPLLPVRRIAAAVETGDNSQRFVGFDDEHQSIREAPEQGAADVLVDNRKLAGIGAHALNDSVNHRAETSAQAGSLVLVPVRRVDHLGASGQGENNGIPYGQRCSSSAFNAAHVMPSHRSSSRELRRRSSSACCALVNGSCSCSRLSQSCAISERRSGGDKRTISSGVSSSIALRIRNYIRKGNGAERFTPQPSLACVPQTAQYPRPAQH